MNPEKDQPNQKKFKGKRGSGGIARKRKKIGKNPKRTKLDKNPTPTPPTPTPTPSTPATQPERPPTPPPFLEDSLDENYKPVNELVTRRLLVAYIYQKQFNCVPKDERKNSQGKTNIPRMVGLLIR